MYFAPGPCSYTNHGRIKQATPLDPNPNALGIGACLKVPVTAASPTINYSFLTTLTIFTAGVLSHYANLKTLHTLRVRFMLKDGKPSRALSQPAIYIKLSDLLRESPSMSKNWAKDVLRLTVKGVEIHATRSDETAATPLPALTASESSNRSLAQRPMKLEEQAVLVTEARLVVPLPKDLTILNERVDPDIAFHPTSGSFALRLRSRVGESIIPNLIERICSIGRLIQFVQVLQKHEKTLKCETVSLGKIVFKYGHGSSVDSGAEVVAPQLPQYRATIDFSTGDNKMILILEKGNPHLRIIDFLTNVLNTKEGLNGVATFLRLTLPALRGLDTIEDAWNDSALCEKGELFVNVRSSDWYNIRYTLKQVSVQNQNAPSRPRKVIFDLRLRYRGNEPWWHIHRTDNQRLKETDNLDDALKPLWTTNGPGWRGMRGNAVAQITGIQDLLSRLDEVMRTFTLSDVGIQSRPSTEASAPVLKQAPTQAPPSRQQQQHSRQQPTPNQSQSQSQGRGMKRDAVIEID